MFAGSMVASIGAPAVFLFFHRWLEGSFAMHQADARRWEEEF